jgi:hypothetical protein
MKTNRKMVLGAMGSLFSREKKPSLVVFSTCKWRGKRIVMLGENHVRITESAASQYAKVFKTCIADEKSCCVLIEKSETQQSKQPSAINSLLRIPISSSFTIKRIDSRGKDVDLLNFTCFGTLLQRKFKGKTRFIKSQLEEFLTVFLSKFPCELTLQEFISVVERDIAKLKGWCNQQKNDPAVFAFLTNCITQLTNALRSFNLFQSMMSFDECLLKACLRVIRTTQSLDVIQLIFQAQAHYYLYVYDAIILMELLACTESTIVIGAGQRHVQNLELFLEWDNASYLITTDTPLKNLSPKDVKNLWYHLNN